MKAKKPKIVDYSKYTNFRWYVDPYPKNYVCPYPYSERYVTGLDAPNGKIKVSYCTINNDNNNILN